MTAGSTLFVLVARRILVIQPNLSNTVMGLGAIAWTTGNLLWKSGFEIPQVVLWWLTFLLLTIVGERIELTRFQKTTPLSKPWLISALGLLGSGLILSASMPHAGGMFVGAALLALAAWLLRFDLAWRTIRQPGLPRFMALCLLSGYGWLVVAAGLVAVKWPQSPGILYDATLHAFFVGFVFSMIFGHAAVIFPAVLGLPVYFRCTAYIPLAVLHVSLLLRLLGDMTATPALRVWGAVGNLVAVVVFLVNMAASIMLTNVNLPFKHGGR